LCENLKSITFKGSIENSDPSSFRFTGCSFLYDVVLPDGVTEISSRSYVTCPLLRSIVIPASLKKIGEEAFKECKYGVKIYYTGSDTEWQSIQFEKDCMPPKVSIYTNYKPKK
jgi:hypothetical protein